MSSWQCYPQPVQITLNIPDELVSPIASAGLDPARFALEALAVEGYRTEQFSESDIRQLLGFENRLQVHAFLKKHGAYLHYSLDDLEQDRNAALRIRATKHRTGSGERRTG
jgi:uncharacterized protein UPF0175